MRWLDRFRPAATGAGDGRSEGRAAMRHGDVQELMAQALFAANAGDYAAALALWEPLAQAGVARAQNNIGACFAEGLGVPLDRDLALKWLRLAAEGGDPVGQRNYAAFHMQGLSGDDPDYAVAADYYRRAAEQGDAPAQDMLSWMLLEGEVMPADPAAAKVWAEKAAGAGIASSMTRLGMLYHNAVGVERDPALAAAWWAKGAEAGDADAQAMLAAACHMGAGVERDGVAALAWLIRATAGGSALAAPFLAPVRAGLSEAGIAEAESRARMPLAARPQDAHRAGGTSGDADRDEAESGAGKDRP